MLDQLLVSLWSGPGPPKTHMYIVPDMSCASSWGCSSEKSSGEGNPLGSSLSLGQDIVGSLELLPAPSDLKAWLCLAVAPALAPRARHKCPSAEKCREREKY